MNTSHFTPALRGDREPPPPGLAIDSAIAQVESVGMKVDSITLDDD